MDERTERRFVRTTTLSMNTPQTAWGTTNKTPVASFGTITSTRTNMRQIQFALKYNF